MKPLPRHDEDADDGGGTSEAETVRPIIPPRAATPQMALVAISLVFVLGVVLGFVLARTI